jgi:hypothetical protein
MLLSDKYFFFLLKKKYFPLPSLHMLWNPTAWLLDALAMGSRVLMADEVWGFGLPEGKARYCSIAF